MADELWGENVALACVRFWMRSRYPDVVFKADVVLRQDTLIYFTRISVMTKSGQPTDLVFGTEPGDFNPSGYKIPQETQAQLMLLLG